MLKSNLLVGRRCDLGAGFCELSSLIGNNFKSKRLCLNENKTVTAICCVNRKGTYSRNFELYTQFVGKRRDILNLNTLGLTIFTISFNRHYPRRCSCKEVGLVSMVSKDGKSSAGRPPALAGRE